MLVKNALKQVGSSCLAVHLGEVATKTEGKETRGKEEKNKTSEKQVWQDELKDMEESQERKMQMTVWERSGDVVEQRFSAVIKMTYWGGAVEAIWRHLILNMCPGWEIFTSEIETLHAIRTSLTG